MTTGISAHDRARTVAVAIDPRSGAAGHRHARPRLPAARPRRRRAGPRRPHRGGGRHRAARRPQPLGRDLRDHERGRLDGAAARPRRLRPAPRPEDRHDLRPDRLPPPPRQPRARVRGLDRRSSDYGGAWQMRVFTDTAGGGEHIALSKGDLTAPAPVLVRMHALNPLEDMLGIHAGPQPPAARRHAARSPPRGAASWCCCATCTRSSTLGDHVSPHRLRQYGIGAQILYALGLRELILLTNSPNPRPVGLEGYGLSIAGTRPIPPPETDRWRPTQPRGPAAPRRSTPPVAVLIVVAPFYRDIADALLAGARAALDAGRRHARDGRGARARSRSRRRSRSRAAAERLRRLRRARLRDPRRDHALRDRLQRQLARPDAARARGRRRSATAS